MHRLGRADAEEDTQYLPTGHSLCQGGVEAGSPLLDHRKVKPRRVGNRLEVVFGFQVSIRPGDCRELALKQSWYRLWKGVPKIRVLGATAVTCPPTRINGELHEIGEPAHLLCTRRFAARQRAEFVQIDRRPALCYQIRVDKMKVG